MAKQTETTNTLSKPLEFDADSLKMAMEMLETSKSKDYIKKIEVNAGGLKALETASGTLKVDCDNPILGKLAFGIQIIESVIIPDGWAMIGLQSGKKIMFRFADGKSFEVPDVTRI